MTDRHRSPLDTASSIADAVHEAVADGDASAFVHVGTARTPAVQYLLHALDDGVPAFDDRQRRTSGVETQTHAIASDGTAWYHRVAEPGEPSPADALTDDLRDADLDGLVLTPAYVPHDAALYLETAGFSLSSTTLLARSRANKTAGERERIEHAAGAAAAGLRAAAAALDAARVRTDGRLVAEDSPVTSDRIRTVADRAIVDAGAFPAGNTLVRSPAPDGTLTAGEPVTVALTPHGSDGYYGSLLRTLVVAGDGGDERRAHVALTRAFRSVEALLAADRSVSVSDVEHDLEAEIRAFGFEDGIETDVAGIGLDTRERPLCDGEPVGSKTVVRIEGAVAVERGTVRLADLYAAGRGWLGAPSRSLDPAALID